VKVDLIEIIELAYASDGEDGEWLGRLVDSARPALDEGLGMTGFFYDVSNPEHLQVWSPVLVGTPPGAMEALYTVNSMAPPDIARQLYRPTSSCTTMSEQLGMGERLVEYPLHQQVLAPIGIMDFLSVSATDPTGSGCLIGAPLPRVHRVPRQEAAVWSRVAAHIASGARLRRSRVPDEAILRGDGKVVHAQGEAEPRSARDALTSSAKAMDRARGKLRRSDPEEAVAIWTALVAGRWTLVDSFDHDGQRYLVARKNDPDVKPARPLTRREQQVVAYAAMGHANKLIAYELGLAPSTVAMHLSKAAHKLGARSRVELIQKYKQRQS
jgi:DNA-binding CsgD family transcriptional regulator